MIPDEYVPGLFVQTVFGNLYPVIPDVGDVYLVRTAANISASSVTDMTYSLTKVLVLSIMDDNQGIAVRWSTFWSPYTSDVDEDALIAATNQDAQARGIAALVISLIIALSVVAISGVLYLSVAGIPKVGRF